MFRIYQLCMVGLLASLTAQSISTARAAELFESRLQPVVHSDAAGDVAPEGGIQFVSSSSASGVAGGSDRLFGLFAPSDAEFSDFVSPLTNPLFFEDPRTLTEIRPIFAYHWIPESNPVLLGGDAQYLATQIRVALTERLSIIATKDGYIWLDSANEPVIPDDNGWADLAAGLKYNLIRDPSLPLVVSVGGTFEADIGSHGVLQGRGDGEFHLFGTAGTRLTSRSHWLSATGFRLPVDTQARSQMWYWSNHRH